MAEEGGNSTVTGVGFEAWVAADFLSKAILDNSISVKPQAKIVKDFDGKEDKPIIEDIVVFRKDSIEFYDCKYRAPKAGQWKFSGLKEHGVLDRLKKQYLEKPNYKLFFATGSPCPLIELYRNFHFKFFGRKELWQKRLEFLTERRSLTVSWFPGFLIIIFLCFYYAWTIYHVWGK